MREAVEELRAEIADIDEVLASLADERWLTPTPAEGWNVRDQVSHLADTNEICVDTITGGERPLNEFARSFDSPESFTQAGCERGRGLTPAEVLEWWRTSCDAVCDTLEGLDPRERVPWGLGMSARMMATARQMEHWAHAEDIRAALGLAPNATPRLRSVAYLVVRAVPYALSFAQLEQPPGALRAELDYDGEHWTIGEEHADNVIEGDALEFCLVGVQRRTVEQTSLRAKGELAELALHNLRAFL